METQKTNKNSFLSFLAMVVAVVVFAAIGARLFKNYPSRSIGAQAAPIQIDEWITSQPLRQSDLSGHVYVLEFWATWCPPCVKSIPHMIELTNKYKTVKFIAISIDSSSKPVKKMARDKGINYYVGMDNGLSDQYSVNGVPTSFVIDRSGRIVWQGHPMNPKFETAIINTLKAPMLENPVAE